MNTALLSVFIPTFFLVSLTPGMCMTLAMSLGMTIGYRRTLWMMIGELLGVACVAVAAVVGIATLVLHYPWFFIAFKIVGACYLVYLGIQLWRSKGKLALDGTKTSEKKGNDWALTMQGFVTAIANPKGWAFMVSLLPPFIDRSLNLTPQLSFLVGIILVSEFTCMTLYATGGKSLKRLLAKSENVRLVNRIAGAMMMAVGIWLALS